MALRIHHLDCATMCPLAGAILDHPAVVGHCFLVETESGLVLVDTGFGTEDGRRLPWWFRGLARPVLAPERTALHQVRRLGFAERDVRHIVLTHLDPDHAGGISDFPRAVVHVQREEHAAALARRGIRASLRYRTEQWAHGPEWALHPEGESTWNGFRAVRDVPGLPPELLLVPLAGHTRGHQAVAVDGPNGWLLHVGDLWPHRGRLTGERIPRGYQVFERLVAEDEPVLRQNQRRILALRREQPEIRIVCSHDAQDLRDCQAAS